jgi:hypothetical protein
MWTRQLVGWTLLLTACLVPNTHVESFIMELKNLAKLSRQLKGGQERNAHNQQVGTSYQYFGRTNTKERLCRAACHRCEN